MRKIKDYDEEYWANQTPAGIGLRLLIALVAIVVVGGVVFGILGWVGGWWNETKRVTGAQNHRVQYTAVIGDWEDLINGAQNACAATGDTSKSPDDPVLVEDPTLAYQATYRRIRSDYNRRMQNFFEAKIAGPTGYPRTVPIFDEERHHPIDWCSISDQLAELHP